MVNRGCVYANDVMVRAAERRFLEGRSCREIASEMENGISEAHLCRLTNLALTVFRRIHEKHREAITDHLGPWILQIDGTVDGEYEMVVAVRDAISGFLLYGRMCHSESVDELVPLLEEIRIRYGTPAATLSDLRATLLAALDKVFPGVPRFLCGFHFLRDEGKDLLEDRHTSLSKILRTLGTRAALKSALVGLPPIDPLLVDELEYGYSTHPERLSLMYARRTLERLVSAKGSDGYGFPFTLRHLEFTDRCDEARETLVWIHERTGDAHVGVAVEALAQLLDDPAVQQVRRELREIAALFQALREAMGMKEERTPLSAEHRRRPEVRAACRRLVEEWDRYLVADVPEHLYRALKHLVTAFRKREANLFPEGVGVEVPFTNNGLEGQFRKVRRNVRKRCGNRSTGRQLTLRGDELLLFQNLGNSKYREVVFGGREVAAVFGEERARWPRVPTLSSRKLTALLEKGMMLMMSGHLPETPYSAAV